MDSVLALNIIKLSNSVYYTISTRNINTLQLTITRIGLDMLVKFVYSLKFCPLFSESTFFKQLTILASFNCCCNPFELNLPAY